MSIASTETPRVYVACLASYNQGILYGDWIDIDSDADVMRDEIAEILANSPIPGAEEWAFHDYEIPGATISEYEDIETLAKIGAAFDSYDDADTIGAFLSMFGADEIENLENWYYGCASSAQDFGYEQFEQFGYELPAHLEPYFDYERFGQSFFDEMTTVEYEGTFYIFDTSR